MRLLSLPWLTGRTWDWPGRLDAVASLSSPSSQLSYSSWLLLAFCTRRYNRTVFSRIKWSAALIITRESKPGLSSNCLRTSARMLCGATAVVCCGLSSEWRLTHMMHYRRSSPMVTSTAGTGSTNTLYLNRWCTLCPSQLFLSIGSLKQSCVSWQSSTVISPGQRKFTPARSTCSWWRLSTLAS